MTTMITVWFKEWCHRPSSFGLLSMTLNAQNLQNTFKKKRNSVEITLIFVNSRPTFNSAWDPKERQKNREHAMAR